MIISLYAHGMTVRDILHHLEQVYGTKLSAEMVSRITDQVWSTKISASLTASLRASSTSQPNTRTMNR